MNEIRIGSITGGHGLQGWVKVFSYTDPVDAILEYSPWILRKGKTEQKVEVTNGRIQGKRLLAHIKGVSNRDEADALSGYEIHLDREQLPELEENEFYWFQLEGLKVRNKQNVVFGHVDHLFETGSNDVLVVKADQDSVDDKERLIPYVEDAIVIKVDQELGEIVVDWEVDY